MELETRANLRVRSGAFGLLACLVLTSVACRTSDGPGELKTDLGDTGNAAVSARFEAYKTARAAGELGCRGTTGLPRVMITGFGLFTGVSYNISGVVAQTFADETFTPKSLALDGTDPIGLAGTVADGTVPADANGAISHVRSMKIRGKDYEVCVLTLDVLWDLAAAIIAWEAEAFQPKLIVMSGRGGDSAIFEGGAVNDASIGLDGFQSNGATAADNAPVQSYILVNGPDSVAMTWDNATLDAKTKPLITANGYTSTFAPDARPSNNYICNNVSYVVLQAATGAEISLAGGKIKWTPAITSSPKAGFFHYPSAASRAPHRVAPWIRVLATIIAEGG